MSPSPNSSYPSISFWALLCLCLSAFVLGGVHRFHPHKLFAQFKGLPLVSKLKTLSHPSTHSGGKCSPIDNVHRPLTLVFKSEYSLLSSCFLSLSLFTLQSHSSILNNHPGLWLRLMELRSTSSHRILSTSNNKTT